MLLCYGIKCSPNCDGGQSFHFISSCRETHWRQTDLSHTTVTFFCTSEFKKKGNFRWKGDFPERVVVFPWKEELTSSCSKTSRIHLSWLSCHCTYYFPLSPACECTGSPGRREHFAHTVHASDFLCASETHVHAVMVLTPCMAQQNSEVSVQECVQKLNKCYGAYGSQTWSSRCGNFPSGAKRDNRAVSWFRTF